MMPGVERENEDWMNDYRGTLSFHRCFPADHTQGGYVDMLVCVHVYVGNYRRGERKITHIFVSYFLHLSSAL